MLQLFLGIAALGFAGCSASLRRVDFPESPQPKDPLANDPCSVRKEPEIQFTQDPPIDPSTESIWRKRIHQDMEELRKIDARYLCGLERIEIMDTKNFTALKGNPDATGRYATADRAILIRAYSRRTFFHEVGHHVHNLGILAPVISQSLALSDPGRHFSEYSKKNKYEDWAETFEQLAAFPLDVALDVYVNQPRLFRSESGWRLNNHPASFSRSLMRDKTELLYRQIAFPRAPLRQLTISVGPAESFPPSHAAFADGEILYLYDDNSVSWSRSQPKGEFKPVRSLRGHSVEEKDSVLTGHLGEHLILSIRSDYLNPLYSGGVPLMILDGGDDSLRKIDAEGGHILGEFHSRGENLGYFIRGQGEVEYKSLDSSGRLSALAKWKVPSDFRTVHVMMIRAPGEFAIIGWNTSNNRMKILRVETEAKDPGAYRILEGDDIPISDERIDDQLLPLLHQNQILFPFRSFQFLSYDLEKNKFELLDPTIEGLRPDLSEIHSLFYRGKDLYALGKGYTDKTLGFRVKFQF